MHVYMKLEHMKYGLFYARTNEYTARLQEIYPHGDLS